MNTKKKSGEKTDKAVWLFLLPAGIIYLSVIVVPVFYSFFISLFKWNGIGEKVFVGLENYMKLIKGDKVFYTAVRNNLIWIVLTIFVTMTVSLGFALILNKSFKGRTFFRGFFYFPCVIAPIAVAIIWRWIYNPTFGFINDFFEAIGSEFSQTWISDAKVSLYAVFAASLWQAIGADILEAATIDGANGAKKFFFVTVPLLKETFVIVIATLIIAAMKVFDVVQGLTGGGPGDATQMLSTYMYSQVFQYNNVGYGTAIACVMVLMMMLVIIPYISITAKED